jgi:hypothetical protein
MSRDVVDRLYGLPLEEFTPQRDLAARELRRGGDREAAGQLAKLPKPTPAAWTANQIAREQPDLLEELLEAGEALRRAQEEALSGGSGQVLRDAMAAQRRAVDAIMTAALEYKPAGRALSRAMADRLRTTLQAAAGDEGLTAALAAGRLVDEAQQGGAWPLGFEVPARDEGAKTAAKPAGGRKARAKKGAPRRPEDEAAKREAEEEAARAAEQAERQRAEREALEAELRQARGNLRVRERAVAAAGREAEEARVAAQAAAERLEAARQAVEDAEAEAEAAERAAAEAAELLQSVRDQVARLEERLD